MSKQKAKTKKTPPIQQAAEKLAADRKRVADAEAAHTKAIENLAASFRALLDAYADVTESEVAFENLAIAQARKKYGVPEVPQMVPGISAGECCCGCPPHRDTGEFTHSIGKPHPFGGNATITLSK